MVIVPDVEWIQNDISTDPSGVRHLKTTGFVKELGTGPGEQLSFGDMNTSISGAVSETKVAFARVDSFGDASGVFNMRFFVKNFSAWDGDFRFLERKTLEFLPDLILTEADINTPTVVPTIGNFISTRRATTAPLGDGTLSGILDEDVSQYVYLAAFANINVSVGQKGGGGAGSWRMSLLYDFS